MPARVGLLVGPGNSARARAKEEEEEEKEEKEPELPAEVSGDLPGEVSGALDSVDPTTRFFQKNLAAKFVRVFNWFLQGYDFSESRWNDQTIENDLENLDDCERSEPLTTEEKEISPPYVGGFSMF